MWAVFALLSAVFAALTSILAKVGIEGVNSSLATALRTVVVYTVLSVSGRTAAYAKPLDKKQKTIIIPATKIVCAEINRI